MSLSRRAFLCSSTALAVLAGRAAHAAWVKPVVIVIGSGPPVAPVRPVVENYYGHSVTDRYRWMEAEGPEWQEYVRAQGDYTAQVLAKIPGREALAAAIGENAAAVALVAQVQAAGTKIFTQCR